MSVGALSVDAGEAVRRVNETLQGSVVEILAPFVPELKNIPRDQAYQRALGDLTLLERCFSAFRAQRAKFSQVLVDAAKMPVTDDGAVLSCGRTLEQVVAMIVRTAAKRHFRARLCPRPQMAESEPVGLMTKVAAMLKVGPCAPAKPKAPPAADAAQRARADELYDALKANLLHEWQVPLVPTYADMTPNLARALGPKILELRDPDHLRRIVDDPAEAAALFDVPDAPEPPTAGSKDERARLSDILAPGGQRLRTEAFNFALREETLRSLVKSGRRMSLMTEALSAVGGGTAKILVAELGLRMDQLALILLVAHEVAGPDTFARVFGHPGDPAMLMRLTQKARQQGISQKTSLADCAAFTRRLFVRQS
ncbi:conserved hypothetical protein [Magnetospirillum sp. LM-5]|nr:conserved hypothetical protein [Magnetospirillum sp. LM-5]